MLQDIKPHKDKNVWCVGVEFLYLNTIAFGTKFKYYLKKIQRLFVTPEEKKRKVRDKNYYSYYLQIKDK